MNEQATPVTSTARTDLGNAWYYLNGCESSSGTLPLPQTTLWVILAMRALSDMYTEGRPEQNLFWSSTTDDAGTHTTVYCFTEQDHSGYVTPLVDQFYGPIALIHSVDGVSVSSVTVYEDYGWSGQLNEITLDAATGIYALLNLACGIIRSQDTSPRLYRKPQHTVAYDGYAYSIAARIVPTADNTAASLDLELNEVEYGDYDSDDSYDEWLDALGEKR